MLSNTKNFLDRAKEKFGQLLSGYRKFVANTKQKLGNMSDTNYNTGMYHLDRGNLFDATFRFKIIKKFWPDRLEAQCKYAYCLILQNMINDATILLHEILAKDPNMVEAQQLLNRINNGEADKIIKEYNEKIKKDSE